MISTWLSYLYPFNNTIEKIYASDNHTIKVIERAKKITNNASVLDRRCKCVASDCGFLATIKIYELTVCPKHANMIMNRITNVYVNLEEL